jgi:hypothetical protein
MEGSRMIFTIVGLSMFDGIYVPDLPHMIIVPLGVIEFIVEMVVIHAW